MIVAAGRLGTVFLLLAPLAGLFRGRLFCPIWYMSERRLGSDSQTLYMARELAQARCLSGDAGEVFHANPWIREVFPNAVPPAPIEPRLQRHTSAQRRLVRAARRNPGSWARAWGAAPCPGSLRAHYAGFDLPIPRDVSARFEAGSALGFHGYRYEASTLRGYAGRRLDLQTSLTPFAGPS